MISTAVNYWWVLIKLKIKSKEESILLYNNKLSFCTILSVTYSFFLVQEVHKWAVSLMILLFFLMWPYPDIDLHNFLSFVALGKFRLLISAASFCCVIYTLSCFILFAFSIFVFAFSDFCECQIYQAAFYLYISQQINVNLSKMHGSISTVPSTYGLSVLQSSGISCIKKTTTKIKGNYFFSSAIINISIRML